MNKLLALLRRYRLGDAYKHRYNCHPDFDLRPQAGRCAVLWKGREIASIGVVPPLRRRFGGSCFVVATGPSLAQVDLGSIAPYPSISLNCAIRKFSAADMAPGHCLIVDRRIFENQWDCVRASILSGANCYFSYVGLSRICEREPELLQQGNIYLIESIGKKYGEARLSKRDFYQAHAGDPEVYLDASLPGLARTIGYSSSAEKGFFPGKTVATWAVQLAHYLGYTQIFILGMDLGGTGKQHFYQDQAGKPPDFLRDYEPYIRACFEQARRAAEREGFGIYNLSAQSTLPDAIIPKISLERALQLAAAAHPPT